MRDVNCSGINWEDISTTDQNTESLSFKLIETIRDCFLHQVIMENTMARGTNKLAETITQNLDMRMI